MICQHFLKNKPLIPSRPGDLSMGISLMVLSISSFVKGIVRSSRPSTLCSREGRSKTRLIPCEDPILPLKADQKAPAICSWLVETDPSPNFREEMEFLLYLSVAIAWKDLVFSSPTL